MRMPLFNWLNSMYSGSRRLPVYSMLFVLPATRNGRWLCDYAQEHTIALGTLEVRAT